MRYKILIFTILAGMICACRPKNNPVRPVRRATEYTLGYEKCYGQFYDSVAANVFCLDLYSEGLKLNIKGKIEGTGWNLCLSDVFSADSLLEVGDYVSETTAAPYTFLPGQDYEGMPNGAYLLYIEESRVQQITVLPEGGFTMTEQGDTTDIRLWFTRTVSPTRVDTLYKAHYRGKLRIQK